MQQRRRTPNFKRGRTGTGRTDDLSEVIEKIKKDTNRILKKDKMEDIELFLNLTEKFGELCARRITTSQIRAIFTEVKRLPDSFETSKKRLNLLRPKLAYQSGRFSNLEPLTDVLIHLIKNVKDDLTMKGFKEFFEAIIAYHKSYGGKE